MVVVGDFMLDRQVYGNAERLSPNAPVPVLAAERKEHSPGGAANVCLDLRALRCEVHCVGVVGNDEHGKALKRALVEAGCRTSGIVTAMDRPTTVKHNYIGLAQHRHPQWMFRVDEESCAPLSAAYEEQLLAKVEPLLSKADVLCLEDYNKGVLTAGLCRRLVQSAKRRGVAVFVDPAAINDYTKYRGATCITPNRTEAALATGIDTTTNGPTTLRRVAETIQRDLDISHVVLTLDRAGMLLLRRDEEPLHASTRVRDVYDVTGAGDMVLAVLAAAYANGVDWPAALELANTAAGLEVERFGVVPIELSELLLAVLERGSTGRGKLRTAEQLVVELAAHRVRGKKIVLTNGCFDILHAGHIKYLREARRFGDLLVAAINSDDSIKRIKGNGRPVMTQADRVMVMSELACVDYIVVFDEDTPVKLLKKLRPDVLVKGADYKSKKDIVGWEVVESYGGKVQRVGMVEGCSTTNIIRKVRQSDDVKYAKRCAAPSRDSAATA